MLAFKVSVFEEQQQAQGVFISNSTILGVQVCQEKCREKSVKIGNFSGS